MKKLLLSALLCMYFGATLLAQVTTNPAIIQQGYDGEITIIFNPNEGTKGMVGATQCYAHTGITYNGQSWQKTGTWRDGLEKYKMTKNADGNWELKITPNIYAYYGVPATTKITQICLVFNDGPKGSKEGKAAGGKDIFVDLVEPGLVATINLSPEGIVPLNQEISVSCHTTVDADMKLTLNGSPVQTATGKEMTYSTTATQMGDYVFVLTATADGKTVTATSTAYVPEEVVTKARPQGVDNGIYYDPVDPTKVTLCTYAASKTAPAQRVFVVGDFNNWTINSTGQMFRDGNYFWTTLTDLTPQKEYGFQYVVIRDDGKQVRISDLYSEKVLTPEDQWEPRTVDPTLMPYPSQADGYVTVIQTGKPAFQWSQETLNFKRPNKNNLIIYEVWIYDHTSERCLEGMMDRLDYIANLGVNCVELMPVCEYDGNNSWGYCPNHYFALEKTLGTSTQLKTFVDECHKRGIAVVLDMVFNHATGNNPMNKLYPYGTDLSKNPWFNTSAPHPDNVYEDWNHDFAPAHTMFRRAVQYWLTEYKVDGYRFDLSHGLCGPSYDAVKNLKDYYDAMQAASAGSYLMLEHWGNNMGSDRPQLVNYGMLCWENTCNAFEQTAMGWLKDGDSFDAANKDGYVSYCENHDEERCIFKAKQFGATSVIKTDVATRAKRTLANLGFQCMLDGSQLFYHYAELGYDYSKYQTEDGKWGKDNDYGITATFDGDAKMMVKANPLKLGWFKQGARMNTYQKLGQTLQLRTRLLPSVFEGNPTAGQTGGGQIIRFIQWGNNVLAVGNFSPDVTKVYTMPSGTWYDYLAGGTKAATTYSLAPGDFKVFTSTAITPPAVPDHYDFPTALPEIDWNDSASAIPTKIMLNGTIYIVRKNGLYDLMGNLR